RLSDLAEDRRRLDGIVDVHQVFGGPRWGLEDPRIRFRAAAGRHVTPPSWSVRSVSCATLPARAPVAQWIRASDFGSEGRGFESLRARHDVSGVRDWPELGA